MTHMTTTPSHNTNASCFCVNSYFCLQLNVQKQVAPSRACVAHIKGDDPGKSALTIGFYFDDNAFPQKRQLFQGLFI